MYVMRLSRLINLINAIRSPLVISPIDSTDGMKVLLIGGASSGQSETHVDLLLPNLVYLRKTLLLRKYFQMHP